MIDLLIEQRERRDKNNRTGTTGQKSKIKFINKISFLYHKNLLKNSIKIYPFLFWFMY